MISTKPPVDCPREIALTLMAIEPKTDEQKPNRGLKKVRPPTEWGDLVWQSPPGRRGNLFYKDGGFALAVGVWSLGAFAGVVPSPVLVIRRISTRRFLARPSRVLLVSTGLSLPSPIR
jgi:hypothetical protein